MGPTISEQGERALKTFLKDPGFDIKSLEYLLNMQDEAEPDDGVPVPRGPTVPYTRSKEKKFVTLQDYEEVMDCEIDLLRDSIRFVRREMKMMEENAEEPMDEESLCTICYANPVSVVFVPCQHTSCRTCIRQQLMTIKECFYCKATVESIEDLDSQAAPNAAGPSTSSSH